MKKANFKSLGLFVCAIVVIALGAFYLRHWNRSTAETQGPVTGVIAPGADAGKRSIASYPSNHEEKKKALLPTTTDLGLKKPRPPGAPTREGRLLTGNLGYDAFSDEALRLPMKNLPSRDWQEKALANLLKYQRPSTKVVLAPTEQLILVIKGEGRYVEEVNVSYLFEDGHRTGFNALIDSQTGQVLNTWGQIVHEQKKKKVSLTPTNI